MKQVYIKPEIETIKVLVEKGFAITDLEGGYYPDEPSKKASFDEEFVFTDSFMLW